MSKEVGSGGKDMEEVFWREETSRQQCSQNSRCGRCPGSFWRNTKDAKLHSRPCHHGLRVLRVTHETEGDAETITVQIFSVRNSLISFRVALWANGGYVEHCDGMRRAGCGQQAREAGKKSSGFRWWARPGPRPNYDARPRPTQLPTPTLTSSSRVRGYYNR